MDRELIERMGDSAKAKSDRAKVLSAIADEAANHLTASGDMDGGLEQIELYHSYLNDSFYWLGQMNAYRGIAAGLEMRGIVEREMDETPTCP